MDATVIENSNNRISWSAPEYEEKERSSDWFWALGIIVATSAIAAIIFENYFFAALLVLGGLLLGFFAVKKPEIITYELNAKGLKIGDRLYTYENIKSFWVEIDKPILFVHTARVFLPVLSMPIDKALAQDIHSIFLGKEIEEVEMKEHLTEKIMEVLGF